MPHLDKSELATVLAALRCFQRDHKDMGTQSLVDLWPEHFEDAEPLGEEGIDTLCEKLNCGEGSGVIRILQWRQHGDEEDSLSIAAYPADSPADLVREVKEDHGFGLTDEDGNPLPEDYDAEDEGDFGNVMYINADITITSGEIIEWKGRKFRVTVEEVVNEKTHAQGHYEVFIDEGPVSKRLPRRFTHPITAKNFAERITDGSFVVYHVDQYGVASVVEKGKGRADNEEANCDA